jgi:hypothetical protein
MDREFLAAVEQLTGEKKPTSGSKKKPTGGAKDDQADYEKKQLAKARSIWRTGKPAYGSLVEAYLRTRGITCVIPATIRFLPAWKDLPPAMLMPFGIPDVDGGDLDIVASKISAVHLTYLQDDGSGKADVDPNKKVIASPPASRL